jgi:uncharacterized 2Fe-2S/4Fe-4S cluster protein (DUF4445 family)
MRGYFWTVPKELFVPILTIELAGQTFQVSYVPGSSLRDLLDQADHRVRTACLGHGACGLCRVCIVGGFPAPPTAAEHLHLAGQADDIRLACQITPEQDLHVEVLNPALPSRWKSVPVETQAARFAGGAQACPANLAHPLAAAIDLGTSNIRVVLIDLRRGRWLAQCRGANPQSEWGADVISRLTLAVATPARAQGLAAQAVAAIGEALHELAQRQGIDLRRVVSVAIVGNSAMLSLLTGDRPERLLEPDNWSRPLDCQPGATGDWLSAWGIHPQATVEVVQPLAGFVGSDLLAGLLALRLDSGPAPALLVDFGTNSEIALWDGRQWWATSAAGGPAFEVSGYSCGMPAESGAICRVAGEAGGALRYTVVDDATPTGLCGSGLVDLVARLLEQKILKSNGRFTNGQAFSLPATPGLSLSGRDVDNLQQAKAAIAAGIQILCRHGGIRPGNLARVCVAGEFGRYLDVTSAIAIGMLPPVPPERVEILADAALLGCSDLILERDNALADLRRNARLINLAQDERFGDCFVKHLYLREMPEE